jgi:hypothetical protein
VHRWITNQLCGDLRHDLHAFLKLAPTFLARS